MHQRSVAPVRGLLSPTRDRHPRAYATWLEECRPCRGFGNLLRPALPRVEHPGLSSDAPLPGLKFGIDAAARSLSTRVVNPGFRETDLGRSEFLWLNGNRDFLRKRFGARSLLDDVGSDARRCRSVQRQLLAAQSWLTKCHPKGVWCGHLLSIGLSIGS